MSRLPRLHASLTSAISLTGRLAAVALLLAAAAEAQTPTARPAFKGIWEPVSYTEDIELRDVFFVNVDVGWAVGAAGTIIHTTDGGKTWDAQLGGDPQSGAEPIRLLRFVDERHGWAAQENKLIRTSDGESWEEIGTLPYGTADMTFTSPQTGFVAAKEVETSQSASVIYRTTDGGRTWKPVWHCTARVSTGGLNRQLQCHITEFHFPTPRVGYAVAQNNCVGMGCEPPPLIAKTEDGGETWQTMVGPGVLEKDGVTSLFFLDEQTGFAQLTSNKLHMTSDGGATWKGIVASPGPMIRFADPTVGWGLEPGWSRPISFTTNGGARWTSREIRFPAEVKAFSLPRRDRAYVVGDHGMVFRYRVVPSSQPLGPNNIEAPAMPGFDSPIDEETRQLEQVIEETRTVLGDTAAAPESEAEAPADPTVNDVAVDAGALDASLPPPSEFTADCCAKSFSRLDVVLGALAQHLPQFIGKYRNLSLLLAGLRMEAGLPGQFRAVKAALGNVRMAKDKESAVTALSAASEAIAAFKQTVAVSMQQQLPPATP